ncbi:MAG: alpha/beta fold hydrolase, partial [Rubrivivax sp.]
WWGEIWTTPAIFCWRQPFRSNAEPDYLPADGEGRRGVVLVHGFVCNRGFWTPWLRRLRAAGHPFVAVNLEPVFGEISDYVAIVDSAVRRVQQATGLPPVLICHSMGGLAVRAWLAQANDDTRAAHIITIGSPHRGTWLGHFSHSPNARQMVLDCDWLCRLGERETPERCSRFTCWYSTCDNIVFPTSTATLAGADNRLLQGPAHVHMAFDERVMAHALGVIASK